MSNKPRRLALEVHINYGYPIHRLDVTFAKVHNEVEDVLRRFSKYDRASLWFEAERVMERIHRAVKRVFEEYREELEVGGSRVVVTSLKVPNEFVIRTVLVSFTDGVKASMYGVRSEIEERFNEYYVKTTKETALIRISPVSSINELSNQDINLESLTKRILRRIYIYHAGSEFTVELRHMD